jgi:lipoate---protein ligase
MKLIVNPFHKCFLNIGSEEYYLSQFEEDIFYLYINSPCIVVGSNQNTHAEINQDYVRENKIDVVRRMSGGGAVYHDFGNLNYGFITKNEGKDVRNVFMEYTLPIIRALHKLGANARFTGRNDLMIDDKKISGTAQYHTKNKVLLHGTLLFDSDMSRISMALKADPRKYKDKGVKSVGSRVGNIRPFLHRPLTIEEFVTFILTEIQAMFPDAGLYELNEYDRAAIQELADLKYSQWEWTYGRFPLFTYRHSLAYDMGIIDIGLDVKNGRIEETHIYGDFFGTRPLAELKEKMKHLAYDSCEVESALSSLNVSDYIFGLSNELLVRSLFSGN